MQDTKKKNNQWQKNVAHFLYKNTITTYIIDYGMKNLFYVNFIHSCDFFRGLNVPEMARA